MDESFDFDHLRLPPEQVRLRKLYPDLPDPIPFATADADGLSDEHPDGPAEYMAAFEVSPRRWVSGFAIPAQHHRIIEEYQAARDRQEAAEEACAAARWDRAAREAAAAAKSSAREPAPEAVPPGGKLTPRQELFCTHYAAQPVGTRAAILAGFSEENAAAYGSRLLRNPLVLDRIARLRAAEKIEYVVERDTVHDKLEAVFFEALGERNHAAAVAALRLQAGLAGLLALPKPRGETPGAARPKAKKSQGLGAEKPRKAKVARRRKPRKANIGTSKKPRKAKQSQ